MKKISMLIFSLLLPIATFAISVSLVWDKSTDPTVIEYKIYQGVESLVYTNRLDVGNSTNVTFSNLNTSVTYHFAATAVNSIGFESDYSSELIYTPSQQTNILPSAVQNFKITSVEPSIY